MKNLMAGLFLLCMTSIVMGADIIPQRNYEFNELYIPKKVAGRYNWLTGITVDPGSEILFQLGLLDEGIFGLEPVWSRIRSKRTCKNKYFKYRFDSFKRGKIPLTGPYHSATFYKPDAPSLIPSKEDIKEAAMHENFLGWRPFNEWGTGFTRMLNQTNIVPYTLAQKSYINYGKKIFKDQKLPVASRKEFEKLARIAWENVNKPYEFETYVMDGSKYWAKAWPGGWTKIRAIIAENRTPYRSNVILQAITRGAARMWGVPFGYLSAYDWYARISYPVYSHMQNPRLNYQTQQGVLKINPNLYRRLWFYEVMSNAAILADESDHSRFSDLAKSGQYRLNWYGELCEEIRDFIKSNPDLGVAYNPIGLTLGWLNGVVYTGDKAFRIFPYNDGEHMTRELMHRVIYKYSENKEHMDEFGPTPYGDLFDVLRLDTPRGPLSEEFLKNYKVIFLAGEQNFTKKVVQRLHEYVKNGGVIIINSEQIKGRLTPQFIGVNISGKAKKADTVISKIDGKILKSRKFTYSPLVPLKGTAVIYKTAGGFPLVTRSRYGKGYVICVGAHWMLEDHSYIKNNYVRRTMLPLAGDLFKNLIPSLLPFRIEGKNVNKQVLYQVNRKGNGWVIALYNNDGRSSTGKARHGYMGPDIVDINKTVKVRLVVNPDLKFAVDLLKHEKCYFKTSHGTKYLEFTMAPGDINIVELQQRPISDPVITERMNMALNKKTAVSSYMGKYGAEKAVDGNKDFSSAWWSKKSCPQWMTVDLGRVETINSVRTVVAWSENNKIFPRISQYTVEASKDGKNWATVVNESKNIQPDTRRGLHRYFEPVDARYLKLNVLFNSVRQGAQVVEFEVYGNKTCRRVKPWKIDPSKVFFPSKIITMLKKKWLSDRTIKNISVKQDEKPLGYDKECYHGKPLKIRGRGFKKGLGCHAKSEIIYKLNPRDGWKIFTAYVGIDDNSTPAGTVEFLVYVDGKIAARSGKVTMKNQAIPIWADVAGAKELKLIIGDCNDGINGDIADWGDACLRK